MKPYKCSSCDKMYVKWLGKCSHCHQWNTIERHEITTVASRKIDQNQIPNCLEFSIPELSCITPIKQQSTILFGGEPGIGKSTFLAQLMLNIRSISKLYITGEESTHSIQERIKRVQDCTKNHFGYTDNNVHIANTTYLHVIEELIAQHNPEIMIIDSIHTVKEKNGMKIADICQEISHMARKNNIAIIVVSHITKSGILAGPKTLEHTVDVVLYINGERNQDERILRAVKNRFGSTTEVGVLKMTNTGLIPIKTQYLIQERDQGVGSVLSAIRIGSRIFITEIQSLVVNSNHPKVETSGCNSSRIKVLVGVLKKIFQLKLHDRTVIINIVGGLKVENNMSDLSICVAIMSSYYDVSVNPNLVFIGEVTLTGRILPYNNIDIVQSAINHNPDFSIITNNKSKNIICINNLKQVEQYFTKIKK